MHTTKAAGILAHVCNKVLDAWDGVETNPQMAVALSRRINQMAAALRDFERAREQERNRRTDDPRLCTWPRCATGTHPASDPTAGSTSGRHGA
jgi:hypothetical protein